MSEKQRRERGSTLEREQRSAIEAKFRREGLSVKAAAEKYGIAEGNLRNALNGKSQDYETRKKIIDLLGIGEGKQFKEQDLRLFTILRRERNTYFTGREDTMKALYQELQRNHLAAVTQAISGMGGMGKTSTALEYAYRCLDEDDFPEYPRYKTIQFVRADTIEALKYGYAEIANALQLPRADLQNLDEAVQAVLRWMVQPQEAPWLLILDNADDPAILSAFLPNAERHFGHVLITSRSHHFTGRIKRIDIEAMEEEEGVTFLYRRTERVRITGSKEEQFARTLVAEMGGLPLALEQAAAYMTQEQVMPFEDYLTNFRDQKARAELMMHAPGYGPHRQFPPQPRAYTEALTVLTTWQMSLANLVGPYTDAVQLLYLSAYLHPVGIPRELVIALLPDYFAGAEGDAAKQNTLYNRLLNALTRYSFIQRNLENNTHNIHILVQTVLRDSMPPEDQKQAYEQVLAAIVATFPQDDWGPGGRGPLHYPHAEYLCNYAEQIGLEIERVGSLLHRLGAALYYQGRLAEAESYFQRALALRQKILPAGHPDIAECLNDLAMSLHSQYRFDDAEPLYQQALAMQQQAFPVGHPNIAAGLNNLAELYNWQERFAEAEPLYKQALAMRQQLFSERHPEVANSLNNLAGFYHDQKRFAESEVLYHQAIEILQQVMPDGHLSNAYSFHGLARLYRAQGRFAEAESLFKKTLEIWHKGLPEGHPHILLSSNSLAMLYREQERYIEAEPLLRQVLTIRRKTLPADHPDIAASLSDLAELYREQERFAEAIPLFQEALDLLLSTRGSRHEEYQAALAKYQTCVAQMKNVSGN